MLTKADLIKWVAHFPFDETKTKLPLEWQYLGISQRIEWFENAFVTPNSEEYIRITRALKVDTSLLPQKHVSYHNPILSFWITAECDLNHVMKMGDFYQNYLCTAQFEMMSQQNWEHLIQSHCANLKPPLLTPLAPSDEFIRAILLHDMRTDFLISALAEYEHELVHFYWETTA